MNHTGAYRNLPALLPTPVYNNTPATTNRSIIPIRRLTSAQMEERRSKGLYFNCDEKFPRGHVCKAKLFVLLLDEEGELI